MKGYLRFGGVERGVHMAHVLGALEDPEGQRSQEISGREQSRGRSQSESCLALQEARNFFKLRYLVWSEYSGVFQFGKGTVVLGTSVFGH